ncbi:MAG: tetratricopeptide repeat protein [Planctomycetes bacterium]|nr:tetratricopeptide repeat protein [Planctomycetota bacterium]
MRNLRAVLALTFTCVAITACSVMPFQGNAGRDVETPNNNVYTAEDTAEDATPEGYERTGEGAPGNLVENPGGERTGTAGMTDTGETVDETTRGADVGKDDKNSREVFDNDRRRDVEYKWLKDRGVIAMKANDLEEAEKYFERALALKPGTSTADVVDLLDEVRDLLSKGTALAPRWADMPAAAQEEYEIEAARTYDAAKDEEASGDWAAAIDSWEKLRRLVKFAPYGAQLSKDYDTIAQAGLDRARVELQRSRKALEEEALKRERRMRDLESQAEEDRRKEEIVELWRQAVYNLELRRFRTASEIVDRILYLDPQFRQADELKRDIADRRLIQLNRDTFEKRIIGYQETLRQLREVMVPQTELLRYPTGLLAERIRARRALSQDAVQVDPEMQQIQNALESKIVDVVYEEETLTNVIADIQRKAGVPIRLHPDVADSSGEEAVSISLDGIPLGSALNIILTDLDLKTQYRFGVLFVVGEEEAADESSVVTRVHDVRDLTFNITEFVGPRIRLTAAEDSGSGPSIVYPDESERTLDIERIEELVTESVAPDSWDTPNALKFFGGQLVATHTPQVQAELRDFLDELRKIAGLMVNIEVRFISVEDDYLQDFGIDFRGNGGPAQVPNQANTTLEDVTTGPEDNAGGQFDNGSGGIAPANPTSGIFFNNQDPNNPPVNFNQDIRGRFEHIYDNALGNMLTNTGGFAMQFAYFVDLTQINAVIIAVQKRKKARVLTAPRLSAFNTQRANITIVNQIPYVQDFELNSATSAAIANPVIDTILDGMVLDVKPTVSNDRRFITIEVQPTVAELVLPIPTFTTTLGPTSSVTIQIPEIKLQTVQTTVRVPDGGAVVIAGLKTVRDKWIESGVPILSDIPLLGILFKRQGRDKEQYNLVIVVHAKVIDLNDEEMRRPGWGGQ